ncbi:MAG: hypothetical protein P4L84_10200 [Isosphaeraceae bacterium]|nr:hypothetical protein [Isosphaeraceae bacterium]
MEQHSRHSATSEPLADRPDAAIAVHQPFSLPPIADEKSLALAITGFVALGVLLRAVRYLLNFPLWCDETMLAANFLDRSYRELLQPLDYRQVCPVLFLFVELTAVKLFGFSESSLRLFPFLCGIGGVLLFRHVAGRIVRGEALLCAVAIFAVSSWPLRYVGEVKPYASDLLVALVVLALAIEWWRRPERVVWLCALAAVAPFAVGLSFPAIFVLGGVSLGLFPSIWRARRRGVWLAYSLFNGAVILTFLGLLRFYRTAPQDHAYFHHDWSPAFPPLDSVWKLVAWFFTTNTGYMFAYPEGGERGASVLTFACFVIAATALWKRGRWTVLAFCLAPFGLALIAAALHRYPYGMSARTMQYVAPAICLLSGLGAALLLARLRGPGTHRLALWGFCGLLAVFGLGRMGYDLSHPYKGPDDERHRGFARWFWSEQSRHAELLCPKADLGVAFQPAHWTKDSTDTYLCYQRIYSPRHHLSRPSRLETVSAKHPLRFVFFNEQPDKSPLFREWLTEMLRSYELRGVERYPLSGTGRSERIVWDNLYLVYDFVPKRGQDPKAVLEISSRLVRDRPDVDDVDGTVRR